MRDAWWGRSGTDGPRGQWPTTRRVRRRRSPAPGTGRAARRLGAVLVTLTLVLAQPALVASCSCAELSDAERFDLATHIFHGRVTSVAARDGDPGFTTRATFAVDTVWKGPVVAAVAVLGDELVGTCAVAFEEGAEYVVFARDHAADGLASSICDGTGLVTLAAARGAYGVGTTVPSDAPAHATVASPAADTLPALSRPLRVVTFLLALLVVAGVVLFARHHGLF
jgi:hypothetical protein